MKKVSLVTNILSGQVWNGLMGQIACTDFVAGEGALMTGKKTEVTKSVQVCG